MSEIDMILVYLIAGLIVLQLIITLIAGIYYKATEKKFRQERIRRLLEYKEEEPFEEFSNHSSEASAQNQEG